MTTDGRTWNLMRRTSCNTMKSKAGLSQGKGDQQMEDEDRLSAALRRLPLQERPAWIKEANRLARIVEHYASLRPKRRRHAITGHYEFVPDALALCQQAACRDPGPGSRTGPVHPRRTR